MRRSAILLGIVLILLLGAMAAAPLLEQPPLLRTHNGTGQFDAMRAKARLAAILGDQRPHPADSAADDQVRGRLIARLSEMGMKPIVRDQLACNELYKQRGVSCARVRNVIAILGPSSGKALLLNAHYDSVPVGPGASDDGIGVATLLEVGSILKDRPLRRPVILLFNEGEELGLIGARAFLSDPLSRSVDSLVNLEARGVRGPVNMFETSRPNAVPIRVFAGTIQHPAANSLSTDVYRLMPNYTDVNSFSERGWLTLNLAPIGNETRYHSPGDDVQALDPATLQHMGDQTLALAQALSTGTPTPDAGTRIFMDLSGRALVTLPLIAGVILLVLLLLAFAALAVKRRGFATAAAIVVPTMIISGALAWIMLALIGAARQGMFWRAYPEWTHLATYAGVLLIGTALIASVGRALSIRQLRVSFWLLFLGIGGLIGLLAPGGIVFFLIPPLIALAGMIGCELGFPTERAGAILAIVFLYISWGAMIGLLQELLNGGPMWIFAPLATLLLLPALIEAKPLIDDVQVRIGAGIAALLVVAGWTAAAAAPAYSADRQQRFVIQHATDAAQHKAWWSIVDDGAPLPSSFGGGWSWAKLPFGGAKRWVKPAPREPSSNMPVVTVVKQARNGNSRTVTLRLSGPGADDIEMVAPEDSNIRTAGVAGFVRPIDRSSAGKYYIGCSGRSCDGAMIELTTDQLKPIDLLVVVSRYVLPPSAAPLIAGRPSFARPQYNTDATITFAHVKV